MHYTALLFILAFIFSVPWNDMITILGLGTLARLLGILAFMVGVAVLLVKNQYRPLKSIHLLIGCLVIWAVLGFFWSIWPEKTWESIFSFLQLALFILLLWQFIRTRHEMNMAYQAVIFGCYVLIIFTLQAWLSGNEASYQRYAAQGVNENELAAMLGLGVPVALYLLMEYRNTFLRILNALYPPLAFFAITLTASRTGLITAILGLVYLLVVLRSSKLYTRILAIILIPAIIATALTVIPDTSLKRLATIGQEASSGNLTGRTTVWKYGLIAWQEQPILGYGIGSFRKVVNPYSISESPHNTFISILVEQGLVGLLLFLLFIAALFYYWRRIPTQDKSFQLILMGALFTVQLTTEWGTEKIAWVFYGLLISHAWLEKNPTLFHVQYSDQQNLSDSRGQLPCPS